LNTGPLNHHSAYTLPIVPDDKMHHYRSLGMNMDVDLWISGDSEFKPWVAMRIDVLPWFEHKIWNDTVSLARKGSASSGEWSSSSTPTPGQQQQQQEQPGGFDDDDVSLEDFDVSTPDPSPSLRIDRLKVTAFADEIKWALWHGIYDTDGLCAVMPQVNVVSVSDRSFDETGENKGLVSASTQIDLGGVRATLLDIGVDGCYDWVQRPEDDNGDDGDEREMFKLLQQWHSEITELEYLVEANSVVIMDHPLTAGGEEEAAFSQWNEDNLESAEGATGLKASSKSEDRTFRPTFSNFMQNHDKLRPPDACLPVFQQQSSKRKKDTLKRTPTKQLFPQADSISPNMFKGLSVAIPEDDDASTLGWGGPENGDDSDDEDEERVTWTVLVAGMRLLWTLDIRDAVFVVVGDLTHTLEMMKLQRKFNKKEMLGRTRSTSGGGSVVSRAFGEEVGAGMGMVDQGDGFMLPKGAEQFFVDESDDEDDMPPSALEHLLLGRRESTASSVGGDAEDEKGAFDKRPSFNASNYYRERQQSRDNAKQSNRMTLGSMTIGAGMRTSSVGGTPIVGSPASVTSSSRMRSESAQINMAHKTAEKNRREGREKEDSKERMKELSGLYAISFEVHLTNPQVQLHSTKTSGSVVIAMSGAYVEGREFLKLVRDNSYYFAERGGMADELNSATLKKSEMRYMLDRVEAYAMPTDVDVSAGLQVSKRERRARRERATS